MSCCSWRPGCILRLVQVGFVVGKVVVDRDFLENFGYFLSLSFHQCSIPVFNACITDAVSSLPSSKIK